MIPRGEDLRSDTLWHRFAEPFNPPGLTNFLGCVQADTDLLAFRSLSFPPFSCSDSASAALYVDGVFLRATGIPVGYTWLPDRIEREAQWNGLAFKSSMALAVGRMAVVIRLEVTNITGETRDVDLRVGFAGGVNQSSTGWEFWPPFDHANARSVDEALGAVVFTARREDAHLVQGCTPKPARIEEGGATSTLTIAPGATVPLDIVAAVAPTRDEALATFTELRGRVEEELEAARENWDEEIRALFTPGNDRYSGHLAELETEDEDIRRIYNLGAVGVAYFKRDNPASVHGRAYDTLMPRYWQTVTFIWDYHLSSLVHAQLDPEVLRQNIERWMVLDMHNHFGSEYLGGTGVGQWYAVNDYAMTVLARDYLRWTGNRAWLDSVPATDADGGRTVRDRLIQYATSSRQFRSQGGLADYGGIGNLLECVSTYIHEVASLNSGNIFALRFAADIAADLDMRSALRDEAAGLLALVQELYVEGGGYWRARGPGDDVREVRHCYDLLTVLNTIGDDLSPGQREEMTAFFTRELRTRTWMRALSASDGDAPFSVRPDHQWTGAYPAWPPLTALGLFRAGRADIALPWLKTLAGSANQGPFGQAHFVDNVVEAHAGGARKAGPEPPFLCDWACSSSGSWVSAVVEGIFGVAADLDGNLTASVAADFDPSARLLHLPYQGRLYDVSHDGIAESR